MPVREPGRKREYGYSVRDEDLAARLDRIDGSLSALVTQAALLAERQGRDSQSVAAIVAEIGGVQDVAARGQRPTLRDRVHLLENDAYASRAAHDALARMTERKVNNWTNRQKIGLFAIAAIGLGLSVLQAFGIGG